jgi:uncharacterized protein involved in exopolysaccharide biosynthesis
MTPQIESEYRGIERKLTSARDNFDNLQSRLVIARQTEALESTEIGARLSELTPARLPDEPSGPPRMALFMVGIFFAVSLGVAMVIMTEMLDSTIRGSKDILRSIDMIPIAIIPTIQNSVSRSESRRRLLLITSLSLVVAIGAVYILTRSM